MHCQLDSRFLQYCVITYLDSDNEWTIDDCITREIRSLLKSALVMKHHRPMQKTQEKNCWMLEFRWQTLERCLGTCIDKRPRLAILYLHNIITCQLINDMIIQLNKPCIIQHYSNIFQLPFHLVGFQDSGPEWSGSLVLNILTVAVLENNNELCICRISMNWLFWNLTNFVAINHYNLLKLIALSDMQINVIKWMYVLNVYYK